MKRVLLVLALISAFFLSFFSAEKKIEVLGLGGALIDEILFISDAECEAFIQVKGGAEDIGEDALNQIIERIGRKPKISPGGSAVNVLKGLSHLGNACAVLSRVGKDDYGKFYLNQLSKHHINPLCSLSFLPTGRVLSLVTPDGQRTMRTALGASLHLDELTLNPKHFENLRLFHVEGYQLVHHHLVERAMQMAKEAGAKVSLDMGCFEIVTANRAFILYLLTHYVDIVFSNEDEARVLTGKKEEKEACSYLSNLCEVAVVTMGKRGAWAQKGREISYFPAKKVNTLDTTGAGDLFASGFLDSYLKGKNLQECIAWGTLVASHIVTVQGAELPKDRWKEIKKYSPLDVIQKWGITSREESTLVRKIS